MSEALERPISACKCRPRFIVEWPVGCIAQTLACMVRPTTTKDSPEKFHNISCAFLRVSMSQWKGFCRAAEHAYNRFNGKAALQEKFLMFEQKTIFEAEQCYFRTCLAGLYSGHVV